MESNSFNNNTNDTEVQFYRKMILEATHASKEWLKAFKIMVATLSIAIVIIVGIFACICKMYFSYAYDDNAIEKSNTNTNINQNINENK
jgi:hypothetical protein